MTIDLTPEEILILKLLVHLHLQRTTDASDITALGKVLMMKLEYANTVCKEGPVVRVN